jgi:hypothetical protein
VPAFLAMRNCSGVRISFHSASVLTTFSVGSLGASAAVSMGSLAWHEDRRVANMRALMRWFIFFMMKIRVVNARQYSTFLKMQLIKCLMDEDAHHKSGCDFQFYQC